jgi:hypothetical protein
MDVPNPDSDPKRADVEGLRTASDLRNTSDALLERLDRLLELERRKRELLPDNPEFVRLAREIEDVAREALAQTADQVELATKVARIAKHGDSAVADFAIRDIPPGPRDATLILAEWRAAERRLAASAADSEDEEHARADVERLRGEYGAAINLRSDPDLGRL